ncbi:MAG: MFS transporter [Gammaproteobacteria bacterium]
MLQLNVIYRSLAYRRFRLYFFGQLVSLTGTWMQHVAQAWLIYRLTGSGFMLGLVAFLSHLPILLFGLFGGVLADRWPRRKLLMAVQGVAMTQSIVLTVLTLGGWVEVAHIIVLAVMLGLANAVEMPARHGLLAELVPRADLPNAIALNSSLFSLARFLGPALAGVLVAAMGEGVVFAINAVSFGAVLLALWAMGPVGESTGAAETPGTLGEGLRFALGHRPIFFALLLVLMVSLFGVPYSVLMPLFADRVLGGQADTLGWLLGAAGFGAFLGALRLASRRETGGMRRAAGWAGAAAGVGLLVVSELEAFPSAVAVLLLVGYGFTTLVASTNTFLQLQVPDELRGRIMALFSVCFIGMTPVGNLIAGTLGEWLGTPLTLGLYGAICITGSAIYLWGRRWVPVPSLPRQS